MMRHMPAICLAGILLSGCGNSEAEKQDRRDAPLSAAITPPPIAPRLEAQLEPTAKMGEIVYRRCASCHSLEASGSQGLGPNLHNIIGRPLAAVPDYDYSSAMKDKGGVWDEAALDRFLEQPMMAIPGNRMIFAGLIDPIDRKALFLYLQENSDQEDSD